MMNINGRNVPVPSSDRLSYDDIVKLAGMKGNPSMTMKARGQEKRILSAGSYVATAVLDGAVFNVAHTGQA